ncbi:6-phosphofructo-2-kinase 1 [Uncinocarpus reesii 1704]|uniref:6-phosphofructo-2-kinase 1 n=1 Tax=Uncinocarpus reesii (strain UAMH 1704) TaxID=336963 RepID=C4JQ01_UNCRE|nr:6-phosphofructo-2-kinase 1 [Uncinocarpus reesii 1704]EEP78388.1 6-phosphofructo-2-kinase 1 [Uncinocarpus reesii 1704]
MVQEPLLPSQSRACSLHQKRDTPLISPWISTSQLIVIPQSPKLNRDKQHPDLFRKHSIFSSPFGLIGLTSHPRRVIGACAQENQTAENPPDSPEMSQYSVLARTVVLTNFINATTSMVEQSTPSTDNANTSSTGSDSAPSISPPLSDQEQDDSDSLMPPPKTVVGRALGNECLSGGSQNASTHAGVGSALTDTPISTAPPSPQINPRSHTSGTSTPGKTRATTLDIPGLTKSKVSPDGRIAQRDVGSKLVIVMVGLPARGKSYITKKMSRYLNWLQHDTRIFNVGARRRVAASGEGPDKHRAKVPELHEPEKEPEVKPDDETDKEPEQEPATVEEELRDSLRDIVPERKPSESEEVQKQVDATLAVPPARILVNGRPLEDPRLEMHAASPMTDVGSRTPADKSPSASSSESATRNGETQEQEKPDNEAHEAMDQSAQFFDPENQRALQLRERVALETLDELLDYILEQGGSVGILDATNSTIKRRKGHHGPHPCTSRSRFETSCSLRASVWTQNLFRLSGPDYKGMDPAVALADFKKRVVLYEKSYVPLGEYEEANDIPFVKTIDVCRKVVAFEVNGFLSSQVVYYLLNFNLSPRQIWISRTGESLDDVSGRIGGDSQLSEHGVRYARALAAFIDFRRGMWELARKTKAKSSHFPPRPGDSTPPNPQRSLSIVENDLNFCVWSSMMQRSIQTVQFFNEDKYDVKEMRMLNELNAGKMEGMTYEEIREKYPEDYASRRRQKLHYRYPGVGGEGYLDVINRLRAVIIEVERMTDHVLLVGHRSVARVLLAYFLGLKREILTDLDVPLGTIYALEPNVLKRSDAATNIALPLKKPYGVEFKVFRYNPEKQWFDEVPNYELKHETYY